MVVKTLSVYIAILGWLKLNTLYGIVSTYYLLIKFLTAHVISEVHGNQSLVKKCYIVSLQVRPPDAILVEGLDT